ncbi:hypothetical protein BpHYR1_012833, partial [Brachionus plicatilis]
YTVQPSILSFDFFSFVSFLYYSKSLRSTVEHNPTPYYFAQKLLKERELIEVFKQNSAIFLPFDNFLIRYLPIR